MITFIASMADQIGWMCKLLTLNMPKLKIIEFINSDSPDEVAHHEPPHVGLHCLHCSL